MIYRDHIKDEQKCQVKESEFFLVDGKESLKIWGQGSDKIRAVL